MFERKLQLAVNFIQFVIAVKKTVSQKFSHDLDPSRTKGRQINFVIGENFSQENLHIRSLARQSLVWCGQTF
jgi:23S rRNA pseudoU1915 N3-methylase RlmH